LAENSDFTQAATIGLFKAVKREWPELSVKNIDLERTDDSVPLDAILVALGEELDADDETLEVGLTRRGRTVLRTVSQPSERQNVLLTLDQDAVILVTGGGRGLTAMALKELAKMYPCRYVVVGRTPLRSVESQQTSMLPDEHALRQHFINAAKRNICPSSPRDIEIAIRGLIAQRQVRQTLRDVELLNCRVEYHSLDVSRSEDFSGLIDRLYDRYGRIDGVIHGAGVLEDRLIGKKSMESFRRVFETKVNPALVLAEQLRWESLKFLVFFSSIAGRFGNRGQADYCAANEFLNKLAIALQQKCSRVISFCWGPWDGGMVNDQHRRLLAAHGVELIGLEEGIQAFLNELHAERTHGPEVVWGRSLDRIENAGL
jgi:NAD(P)-dependent dehydrogenase (short-subunit alcohol dehydrogenase family)